MRKLWKVDTSKWEVREVYGTAWPEEDSEGQQIYENTHFKEAGAAWESLIRSAEAGVKLGASCVERARSSLREAEQAAAQDAVNYAKAMAGFEQHRQPGA